MIALTLALGLAAIGIAAFFLLKKSKKFQKLETTTTTTASESETYTAKPQAYRATIEIENHPNLIRPESYQQRNLDREVGGLEEGKQGGEKENKDKQEKHVEDAWDKRSEDVDKMGSFNPLAGHDKESMTWRLKKIRLKIGKHLSRDNKKDATGKNYDSRYNQQGGFSQIIKARQDFGHENENGGMGMGR